MNTNQSFGNIYSAKGFDLKSEIAAYEPHYEGQKPAPVAVPPVVPAPAKPVLNPDDVSIVIFGSHEEQTCKLAKHDRDLNHILNSGSIPEDEDMS